jgi:alkanesulfonate monooxygenase SsuD/methylene tetrahydromethanopterin reductase-like flavin-dependent oxidoreductase (luciferase family)
MGNHAAAPRPYPEIRDFAQRAEALGFDSIWAFDHVLFHFPGEAERGTLEGWTVLSLLAEATKRVELGTLVLGLRLRNPGLLAKMAATLDDASGGRLTLGVGAGWHDPEYEAFGYPVDNRLGRSEEAFALLVALIRNGRASLDGRWVSARDAVLLPPARPDMTILSAGRGPRMLRMVARHADAANIAWMGRSDDPVLVQRMAALDAACRDAGRDPASLTRTVGVSVRFPDATEPGPSPDPSKRLAGTSEQIAAGLRAFAEAGYAHLQLWLEPMNEHSLERLAESWEMARGA